VRLTTGLVLYCRANGNDSAREWPARWRQVAVSSEVKDLNSVPSRKKDWLLTQEAFDYLLDWLGPNREQAGNKYEEIRRKLIKIFTCRGCFDAEDLADETINRVTRKIQEIGEHYVGDPALYFYGVSQNVYLEYVRKKPEPLPPPPPSSPPDEKEQEHECLDQCMQKLTPQNRELVLQYYQKEKKAKVDYRKELAQQLGIAVNALRIRAYRIRASLQECMRDCLAQKESA
jgi:RNA polymerase sigma factor (sigma-70 family)